MEKKTNPKLTGLDLNSGNSIERFVKSRKEACVIQIVVDAENDVADIVACGREDVLIAAIAGAMDADRHFESLIKSAAAINAFRKISESSAS